MIFIRSMIAFFLIGLGGCSYNSGPVNNADFRSSISLIDLEGFYENKMEVSEGRYDWFSRYLWIAEEKLEYEALLARTSKHKAINHIRISFEKDSVKFEAIKNDCVVASKKLELENRFDGSEFIFDSSFQFFSEVHVGPDYRRRTIGVDTAGDPKVRSLNRAGGLLFLFLPFAITQISDGRLKKAAENPTDVDCEINDYWVELLQEEKAKGSESLIP